jgi:predicted AAA+ superfamily ATPase
MGEERPMSIQEAQRITRLEERLSKLETTVARLEHRLEQPQSPEEIRGTPSVTTSIGQAVRGALGRK